MLARKALVSTGTMKLGAPRAEPGGRLVSIPVEWAGHEFTLTCVYLPAGDPTGQRAFIQQQIAGIMQQPGHHVLAGDYNYVPDPAVDSTAGPGGRQPDKLTHAVWVECCPDLVDCFRARHPARRQYTYVGTTGGSRIDRV